MKQFEFEKTLNAHGLELVDAYKTYIDASTPPFIKAAIKDAIFKERNCTINNAICNEVSVAEFDKIMRTSLDTAKYLTGEEEEKDAAIAFMAKVFPADAKISFVKGSTNTVIVQKRVGMKLNFFLDYFGTENRSLFDNFAYTFVDTRIRKRIFDVLPETSPKDFKIVVSKAYREPKRNLINIAIGFNVSTSNLTEDICAAIMRIVRDLDEVEAEFS